MHIRTVPRGVDKHCAKIITNLQVPVPHCKMEELKNIFWRYDTDRDGKLSKKELKEAFNYLGATIPGWRARRAINHADDNGDGYISDQEIDEVVKYAVKLGYVVIK